MSEEETGQAASVIALAADLMFASRIRAAAQAAGTTVELVRSSEQLVERVRAATPARVLVDLDARAGDPVDAIRRMRAHDATQQCEIIAFVSHVREDLIAAARAAGATRVVARSAFVRMLPELVRG